MRRGLECLDMYGGLFAAVMSGPNNCWPCRFEVPVVADALRQTTSRIPTICERAFFPHTLPWGLFLALCLSLV